MRLKEEAFAGDHIPKDRTSLGLATWNGLPSLLTKACRFELTLPHRGAYMVQSAQGVGTTVFIPGILSL